MCAKVQWISDFSQGVKDVLQVYLDNSWVTEEKIEFSNDREMNIFSLTKTGFKIAKFLYGNLLTREKESLKIIDRFDNKNQLDIIRYSYFWYPKTTKKSKIKKDIFGRKNIFDVINGELEDEYKSIILSGKTLKDEIRETWKY